MVNADRTPATVLAELVRAMDGMGAASEAMLDDDSSTLARRVAFEQFKPQRDRGVRLIEEIEQLPADVLVALRAEAYGQQRSAEEILRAARKYVAFWQL